MGDHGQVSVGLVDRESQVAELLRHVDAARNGQPGLMLCGGEPGVGKTRLAKEAEYLALGRGMSVAWGRCAETAEAPPYWPWRQVLRVAARLPGAADVAVRRQLTSDLAIIAPEAFGTASRDAEPVSFEPRFRIFDAVSRFLHDVGHGGLLVILDDLHWADAASLLLLGHLARDLRGSQLVVLATYRDSEPRLRPALADLIREPRTSRLTLAGLSLDGVRRLLTATLGVPPPIEAVERIHRVSGGNPFFVDELARTAGTAMPVTVRAAIRRRMSQLSTACQEMLRVAAVVGPVFSPEVVAAVLQRPLVACLEATAEAVDAGLLWPDHRFRHALIRDAIEAELPPVERSRLHAASAQVLEERSPDAHLYDLAHHWAAVAQEGARARAAHWSQRAADEAMARFAYEEAARLYRQALEHGAATITDYSRFDLLLALGTAYARASALPDARAAVRAAAAQARQLGRPDLLAEAALVLEPVAVADWDATVRGLTREALGGLDPAPTPLRARLLARLAECGMYLDEQEDATEAGEQALGLARELDETTALVAALRAKHMVRSDPTGAAEREALGVELLALGERLGNPATTLTARSWLFDARCARGELQAAAAELENIRWCAGQVGGPLARWHLLRYEAVLAQARGEFGAARRYADAAFEVVAPLRHPTAFPVWMALRVTIDHHCGPDVDADYVRACRDDSGPGGPATPGHAYRIMDYLGPAFVLQEAGYLDEAAAKFHALGPVNGWRTPPFHRLIIYAFGTIVAIRAEATEAVAALRDILRAHRGLHAVSGNGVEHYCGPVELYLGMAASYLGEWDTAIDDLSDAEARCRAAGAAGHLVEARYELASALLHRKAPGDEARAQQFVDIALLVADATGMVPFQTALRRLVARWADAATPLTAREREVARCVARGLTNRRIAAELVLSERTAQNHVQHILTKLGFANRSQIAVWAAETGLSTSAE